MSKIAPYYPGIEVPKVNVPIIYKSHIKYIEALKQNNRYLKYANSEKKELFAKYDELFKDYSETKIIQLTNSDEYSKHSLFDILLPEDIFENIHQSQTGINRIYLYKIRGTDHIVAVKLIFYIDQSEFFKVEDEFLTSLRCSHSKYLLTSHRLVYDEHKIGIIMDYGGTSINNIWDKFETNADSIINLFLKLATDLNSIYNENIGYFMLIAPPQILVNYAYKGFSYTDLVKLDYIKYSSHLVQKRIKQIRIQTLAPEIEYCMKHIINFQKLKETNNPYYLVAEYSLGLTMYLIIIKELRKKKDVQNEAEYFRFQKGIKKELKNVFKNKTCEKEKGIIQLIMKCIEFDPKNRITFAKIIQILIRLKNL